MKEKQMNSQRHQCWVMRLLIVSAALLGAHLVICYEELESVTRLADRSDASGDLGESTLDAVRMGEYEREATMLVRALSDQQPTLLGEFAG